ncbi:MAG: diguanylate cyclase [Myxococcales bacterium]|nr:diguanylate cyclase [Myxococcales bacterium]
MEGHKPSLLLVGDASQLAPARSALEEECERIELARDGPSAIKLAGTQQFDLVLMALELPGMDGLQVLRMLRASSSRRHLPVLLLSQAAGRGRAAAALGLGADDFLPWPLEAEELRARIHRSLAFRRQIDELIAQADELHLLSVTDGLTQLANHRHFQERLRDEFRRAQRYDDPLSLLLLDLDYFKSVNDELGHKAGDQVLREVASSLRRSVRETDLVARYGGEEFAVLLPKTQLPGALTVAERVSVDVASLRLGPSGSLRVTVSLGVSGYPGRAIVSSDQLFRAADDALYRAKRDGRNRISLYQAAESELAARAG